MAYRPCLTCGQRFYGASNFTYVTWFDGEDRLSFRLAQCHHCASEFRNPVSEAADSRLQDDWAAAPGAPAIQNFPLAAAAADIKSAPLTQSGAPPKDSAIAGAAARPR